MDALLVFAVLLWTTVAIVVGVDARGNGRSGVLWGLLTFVLGIFGVLVYLFVRLTDHGERDEEDQALRRCPNCEAMHDGAPRFCSDCGTELGEADETGRATVLRSGSRGYCSNCTSRVALDADVCPDCEYVLG